MRLAIVALLFVACSTDPGQSTDAGTSTPDAGTPPVPGWSDPAAIDEAAGAGLDLVATTDAEGHVAAAYFRNTAKGKYDLVVARENGAAFTLDTVQAELPGHFGVSLAFDPSGNPVVAYLGGGTADAEGDGRWHSFETGESLPSDAVIARRGAATWTIENVAKLSADVVRTGFPIDDNGVVTGLWPALAISADGATHLVLRDMHFGNDESASASSNLEYRRSGATAVGELIAGGPADPQHLQGAGTYTRLVLADGEPAAAFTLGPSTTDDATQVWFARRATDGTWTKQKISDAPGLPRNPPSLAHDAMRGFALAFFDAQEGDLVVARSADGVTWTNDTVEALGETGRQPSVAFGSDSLGALYAFCRSATDPSGKCPAAKQELRFRARDTKWSSSEKVARLVPEAAALVVDAADRFVAIWRDPAAGVRISRRTP